MKYKLQAIQTGHSTIVILSNKKNNISKSLVFTSNHLNFSRIQKLLNDVSKTELFLQKNKIEQHVFDEIEQLHSTKNILTNWSNGLLEVSSLNVKYKGKEIADDLSQFLIKLFVDDPYNTDALSAWSKYLELVEKSGTFKTQNRLFSFLSHNDLQISKDGKVLAWKAVRVHGEKEDGTLELRDIYTGTMDNSVGQVVTMQRSKVDDNDGRTCSTGLHVASHEYAFGFAGQGDAIVQVEVDITDIVSVPTDYNGQKARTCRYEVKALVGIVGEDIHSKEDMLRFAPVKGFNTDSSLKTDDENDLPF